MRLLTVLVLCGLLAACSGPREAPPDAAEAALLDVWGGLDAASATRAGQDLPCADAFGTWFEEFGVRGLACVASAVVAPEALVARAGVAPFRSGPHAATAETLALDLNAERGFGHYDPAFVQWVVENGVVGEGNPAVRALMQPGYDRHLRRLARLYWLTYADMAADGFPASTPAGILSDYAAFLEGGPIPEGAEGYGADGTPSGFSVFAFTARSERLLPRLDLPLGNEWEAKYEANTAYGFWLRRRADGTLATWHDGLRRLLRTYDADWLAARG